MLFRSLFVSNGNGTGWHEDEWRGYQENYLENVENGELLILNCPHYIHDYEYDKISDEITIFITDVLD